MLKDFNKKIMFRKLNQLSNKNSLFLIKQVLNSLKNKYLLCKKQKKKDNAKCLLSL